ncbi:uncharacterized protein K02A2.6-like [Dermacentor silvarum]|uniref:uncharacterized protein K02A2.6-like n=1 Tax=Dermacentor silvarum TaxID=543639 RepID=UPI002101B4C2|nr:uncharacterized protein K02A2.6-like [Dermacentor silvarum]
MTDCSLELVTDLQFPTRVGSSVARDTTPDLAFTKNAAGVQWANLQEYLGSDHFILSVTQETRVPPPREFRVTDWDEFRKLRKADQTEYGTLKDLFSRLAEDALLATKTVQTDLQVDAMDSRLAHLLEAKKSLVEKWRTQKLNRRLRKRISLLNKEIEDYSQELSRQQWNEACSKVDGQMRHLFGKLDMTVQFGSATVNSSLVVVDHRGPLLCGRDTIEAFRKAVVSLLEEGASLSVNVVHGDTQLSALEFSDILQKLGCCRGPPVKLYLKDGAQPRFCKARTVPYAMRAQVAAEIDRLVGEGVLSPVSVAEWATPVVPVAKKNGDIRLCGDFKLTVNPATRVEQYPLPKIDDIFAALSGGEVFSTLDLRNAYNQLPLDEEAKKIVVLNTHKGLFCYNRLAFGIASAPALFQRRIEAVLHGIPGVKVYLDDIIVAEKAHDAPVLRQVFEQLRANGLTLNREKCRFREKEVAFLGHRIDARGLHPLQDNLEAVLAAPPPTSKVSDYTNKDDVLQQVKTWILRGWPRRLGLEQQWYQPYFARRHELAESKGVLYWGHHVVLPEAAQAFVLKELDDTHPGMTAMKNIARSIFWYPGLDKDIEKLVKRCPQCVQCLPMPTAQVPANWPKTNRRWCRLHMDFAGPLEGHMIFVLVDAETKWIEAVPLRTATAATTVDTLRCIFARFGLPRTVMSDNGPQFTSAETARFFRENGVRHITTAPYYPQSNGLAERAVRTIKEGLKKSQAGTLQSRLAKFLLRYRTTPTREEQSPAEMLLGFQPRTRLSTYFEEEDGAGKSATVNGAPSNRVQQFVPGTQVWTRQYNQLGQRWLPGTVTTVEGQRLLTVDTPKGVQRRHVDQERPSSSGDTQSTSSQALQAGQPEMGASGGCIEPTASPVSTTKPIPLRRSTRTRKPPDRLLLRGEEVRHRRPPVARAEERRSQHVPGRLVIAHSPVAWRGYKATTAS